MIGVLDVDVDAMLDKELNDSQVSIKRCIMQSIVALLIGNIKTLWEVQKDVTTKMITILFGT